MLEPVPSAVLTSDELNCLVLEFSDLMAATGRWRSLAGAQAPPAGGNSWTLLYDDEATDVWLLTWLRSELHLGDQRLHDHGHSTAAFSVVAGQLEEQRPGRSGQLSRTAVGHGQASVIAPGVLHRVANVVPEHAVSIHAYSPPLRSMTFHPRDRLAQAPRPATRPDGSPVRAAG